jgi:hypothetical protein
VTVTDALPSLDALPSVSLGELDAAAALQARRDRKYVTTTEHVARLLHQLGPRVRILEIDGRRQFAYESVYFDTPSLDAYLATARRRPGRAKVRTRRYVDSDRCVIEVKTSGTPSGTVKARHDHDPERAALLDDEECAFVATHAPHLDPTLLRPTLQTRYRRSTLLVDASTRVTLDIEVTCTSPDGRAVLLGGPVLLETKTRNGAGPADRALWAMHVRPLAISKYGTSMAALHPGLPGNRWHRTVRHHVSGPPTH